MKRLALFTMAVCLAGMITLIEYKNDYALLFAVGAIISTQIAIAFNQREEEP
jgi:hypothetical protein